MTRFKISNSRGSRSAEAQAAALADGIAYTAHDIDDGLRGGLIELEQIGEVDFLRGIGGEIAALSSWARARPCRS